MSKLKAVGVVFVVLGVLAVLFFVGLGLKILLFPVAKTHMAVDMTYKTTRKVLDADKAIYNYEWFKQQKADIQSLYRKEKVAFESYTSYIKFLPKDRSKWRFEDRQELSRLRTVVDGIKHQTSDSMATYNARSKMVSRNIFKDNLPVTISRAFIAKNNL